MSSPGPRQLREERLLEEAAHTDGDLLHLATVFGITASTALRYTAALAGSDRVTHAHHPR